MFISSPNPGESGSSCRPQVWVIGGGKGGTGKSLVAATFGMHLAQTGRRVVLIDGDLGAPNLHSFLGLDAPAMALGDFLERRVPSLEDVAVETSVQGLRLISGARNGYEIESLKFFQKTRLLRLFLDLNADVVLVDLGAGTSLNVLDFFSIADRGVVVILPEPTSVENAYRFLKAAYRRRVRRLGWILGLQAAVGTALDPSRRPVLDRPVEIMEEIAGFDPAAAEMMRAHLESYLPHLVINQARSHEDAILGDGMRTVCDRFLGMPIRFAGAIPHDPVLIRTVKMRRPLLQEYPRSGTAGAFRATAEAVASPPPRLSDRQNDDCWGPFHAIRDPYHALDVERGAPYREILASYMRLRSYLRPGSPALMSIDSEAERQMALTEVEQAFRTLARNLGADARRASPSDRRWPSQWTSPSRRQLWPHTLPRTS